MKHEVLLQYNIEVWKLKNIIRVIPKLLLITKDEIMNTNKEKYLEELKKINLIDGKYNNLFYNFW